MNITLVTASFNDEVHATFNDKKTGCGINLLKPENVTRFRRSGKMTDLGELTCERCKTKIAKEMIKSDQKEMKAILKEEKLRAKKGIEDEGIVPLGNTTAKITTAQTVPEPEPEPTPAPEPVPPKPAYQPNGAPALDDELSKYAINKPAEEPEEPKKEAFVLERPVLFGDEPKEESAPIQQEAEPVDDFLSQFAYQKPEDEEPAQSESSDDDFLSMFSASQDQQPAQNEPVQTAPEEPPVIDDISAALAAMQGSAPAPKAPAPQDDILSQFAIDKPAEAPTAPVLDDVSSALNAMQQNAPAAQQSEYTSDWDAIANQLFGGEAQAAQPAAPVQPAAPTVSEEPAVENVAPTAPVIKDIAPAQPAAPVAPAVPEIEDLVPVQPAAPVAPAVPEIEDIVPVQPAAPIAPAVPEIEDIVPVQPAAPTAPIADELVLEDINEDDDDENFDFVSEHLEPKGQVIDDVSEALNAMNFPASTQQKTAAAAPAQSAPVIDDAASALSALNTAQKPVGAVPNVPVQPVPAAPVQPTPVVPVQPTPVIPVQPVPTVPVQPMPAQSAGAVGQVISVPQLTGYDAANQPVYTYIQMQIQGYDAKGQPILVPLPGQNIPLPTATPMTFNQQFNQNTRLRDAIAAAQEIPTSSKDMTPGQRIAAQEAAKGSPLTANVSKIATNPHTRSTSQAFVSAISTSKEYANQSLTETQGLQQRTAVLDSIEDVLSQLGDNSLKEKKMAEAKAQTNVPAYQEYKTPTRAVSYSTNTPKSSAPVDNRPMTAAELKAKKKQDKIDAKFRKEMQKRK